MPDQARGGVPSQVCWSTSYWRSSGRARCGVWRRHGSSGSTNAVWCCGSAGCARGARARVHHDRSVRRPAAQGQHADRDDAGARAGGHHPGQRHGPGRRGRLLQGGRRADAVIQVEDYRFAVSQMAQTSLRSIIGKSDLDDLLSNREKLNQGLELMIDSPAMGWGVQIDRVEIKDVSLPETMKRSMARQAEADRERRARVINADAELQASKKLAEAAAAMSAARRAPTAAAADSCGRGGEELHPGAALPGGAAAVPGVQHHTSRRGGWKRPGGGGTVPACRSFRGGARVRSAHPDDGRARLPGRGAKPESAHPDIVGEARVDTSERNTDGRPDALTASAASGSSPIPASDTPAGRPRDSVRSTRAPSRAAGPVDPHSCPARPTCSPGSHGAPSGSGSTTTAGRPGRWPPTPTPPPSRPSCRSHSHGRGRSKKNNRPATATSGTHQRREGSRFDGEERVPSLFDLAKLLTGRSDSCGRWPRPMPGRPDHATLIRRRRNPRWPAPPPLLPPIAAHVPCSRGRRRRRAGSPPDQDEVAQTSTHRQVLARSSPGGARPTDG